MAKHPQRGDATAYDRYLKGMDASMRQKVALTAAHLVGTGVVADLGMGSGTGSEALAALYPRLQVVGVDLDPEMVARATERFDRPNLRFQVGDIATPCFPDASLDGILDSSVLHHVTTFTGYDRAAAVRALTVQARQLAPGGVVVVRDFLEPPAGEVWLDVPADDALPADAVPDDTPAAAGAEVDPRRASTAALLERFSREFQPLHEVRGERGFPLTVVADGVGPAVAPGWRRYRLSRTHAVEFVLRKDYRRDWEREVLERYTYLSQPGFEAAFAAIGLRVLASTPIRNPWIVANRFEGRFVMRDVGQDAPLDWPATNYVIAGERPPAGEGVSWQLPACAPPNFLEATFWRRDDGRVFDLVRRPGVTLDVLPWFREGDALSVLARRSYPRPLLGLAPEGLDGLRPPSWVTEPLTIPQGDRPFGEAVEDLLESLLEGAPGATTPDQGSAAAQTVSILEVLDAGAYTPSPGGLQEEVRAIHAQIRPPAAPQPAAPGAGGELGGPRPHAGGVWRRLGGRPSGSGVGGTGSGFASQGVLRAMEAQQVLRAAQVGGLPDARLELNVYALLTRLGVAPGAWIGAQVTLADPGYDAAPDTPPDGAQDPAGPVVTVDALMARPSRRAFRRASADASTGFLALRGVLATECGPDGAALAAQPLAYVVPTVRSLRTVAVAPLRRINGQVFLGVAIDDLPAAQCFTGRSDLPVAPAWRLPTDVSGWRAGEVFVRERLQVEHGLQAGQVWPLGGAWFPSPGVTPEVVHPLAVEILPAAQASGLGSPSDGASLRWVPLAEAARRQSEFQDGHLSVLMLRAAHALGLLGDT